MAAPARPERRCPPRRIPPRPGGAGTASRPFPAEGTARGGSRSHRAPGTARPRARRGDGGSLESRRNSDSPRSRPPKTCKRAKPPRGSPPAFPETAFPGVIPSAVAWPCSGCGPNLWEKHPQILTPAAERTDKYYRSNSAWPCHTTRGGGGEEHSRAKGKLDLEEVPLAPHNKAPAIPRFDSLSYED